MSFMDPPAYLPPSATNLLINNVSTTTTSSITSVLNYQSLLLQVTGTWKGTIKVEGRIDGLDWIQLPIQNGRGSAGTTSTTTGALAMSLIGGNGFYYFNVLGMTTFRVTATPASGSVTVNGKLLGAPSPLVNRKRVNNAVAESYQVTVAAGATSTIFSGYDVSAWPLIAFAFRSEVLAGGWQTQVKWNPTFNRHLGGGSGNGSPESGLVMIDTTSGAGQCDFVFNRAELATVQIKNFDSSDHTYDAWILGIS